MLGSSSDPAGIARPPHADALLTARALWDSLPEVCRACQPLAEAEAGAGRLVDAVFVAAPVGLALLDKDLRCVRLNPRAADLLQIDAADALGRTPERFWPAIDQRMLDRLRHTIETGEAAPEMEFAGPAPVDGDPARAWAIAHDPIGDGLGGVAGVVISINDVTDRVRAQEELRRAREALEAVFRASPLAVSALDAAGRVTHWNLAAERLFGWRAEEVVGSALPAVPDRGLDELRRMLASPHTFNGQIVDRLGSDGSPRHVAIWTAPILEDGQVRGSVGVLEDVGPRLDAQRMSDALNGLAAALASALGARDVAAAALDAVLRGINCDRGQISLVRAGGVEDLLSLAADGTAVTPSPWRGVLRDGPVAVLLRDNIPFWFASATELAERFPAVTVPVGASGPRGLLPLDVQEGVVGVLSVERDAARPFSVAEREFARTASHLVAQALARARLYEAERSGRDRLERVYQVTAALGGASTRADVARVLQTRILSALGADAFALALAAPDGKMLRVEQSAGYPEDPATGGAIMADSTTLPVAALLPSTDAYRERHPILMPSREVAAERYPDRAVGMWDAGMGSHGALPLVAGSRAIGSLIVGWFDPRTFDPAEVRYLEAVAAACAQALVRVALYERAVRDEAMLEEVVRQMPVGVILAEAPSGRILIESDRNEAIWRGRTAIAGIEEYGAWQGHRPDGTLYRPADWPIARSLQRGEIVVDEEIEIDRLDGTRGVISVSAAPVRDADRRVVAAVEVRADITERTEAAAMRDTFMGVLSHELRTPTTLVLGGAELLASRWDRMPDLERRSLIDDVRVEASRLNRMIDNLVVLASAERGALPVFDPEPVLLQRCIGPIIRVEETRWPAARFTADLPADLPAVAADASALEQLLRNLLGNAAKYAGGIAEVSARRHGNVVDLVVADRGPGIDPQEHESIFRPFYRSLRTARSSAGSGIGLFVCRHLVEAMGGTLRFEENPGGGSRFVTTFRVVGD